MRKIKAHLFSTVSLIVLCISCTCIAAEEDRFAAVSIETVPVANGIYMLVGSGGNIGVSVGDDGVLMIDDAFPSLT